MNQEVNLPPNDEIDLLELFRTIWSGRYVVLICVLASVSLASVHLRGAERKYTVNYIFQAVGDGGARPNMGGLAGLASLSGVSLPSGGSGDFKTFEVLLQSEEVASELLSNKLMLREIFAGEWNVEGERFQQPPSSTIGAVIRGIKKTLTGNTSAEYSPPSTGRLSEWLKNSFSVSEDLNTGFLKLTAETPNPALVISVLSEATKITDQIIKDRFVKEGEKSVIFYQQKIAAARSREHREALAQLIMQEEQKLMLASNGNFFIAKPLTTPSVSLRPTSPKSPLVLALALVLGSFVGIAITLIRKVFSDAQPE
jgi:hypothetical protein